MMDSAIFRHKAQFRRKQLEGILTDCIHVYKEVLSSGVCLNNNENGIRDELVNYLEKDDYKLAQTITVKNFHVDHEVQEGPNGRVDIRFLQVNPYEGQHTYFIIECKRLDGGNHLCKEYVEHGIKRFETTDKYSTYLGINAMMGFLVKELDVPTTCVKINSHLTASEQLICLSSVSVSGCYEFESNHTSNLEAFTLLHLWVDFTSCVRQTVEDS